MTMKMVPTTAALLLHALPWLLLSNLAVATQTSKLQFQIPASLRKPGPGYDHRDALFGIPPYGGSIHQQVYYADSTLCDPKVDTHSGYPEDENGSGWKTPYILMVDRGDCSFVQKVRNAQRAGASGVLIADSLCLCEHADCQPTGDEMCEAQEPIMADDGSGTDISIPSFLVFKEDADQVKAVLMQNQHVRAEMSFKVPAPDSRVEYELWTSPSDRNSRPIEETFGLAALALKDHASFKPHPYVYDGLRAGCQGGDGKNQCYNLCTNNGRYCSTDPDDDLDNGATGADVVRESLRRICIWKTYGEPDGIGVAWWTYVQNFIVKCDTPDEYEPYKQTKFNDQTCVDEVMTLSGVDKQKVEKCMTDSGGVESESDAVNVLLDKEIKDQEASGVVLIPSLLVNKAVVHGSLSFATTLKAVCSGYAPGSEPQICEECANCQDELKCIKNGHCSAKLLVLDDGTVPIEVFVVALLAISVVFCCVGWVVYERQQRHMRDQIHGIVAEYMPVTAQNAKDGTSLAIGQDDEDGFDDEPRHESFSIE